MKTITLTTEEQKELQTEYDTIEVTISYWIGGPKGIDWTMVPRGYELDITPCKYIKRVNDNGTSYTIRQTTIDFGTVNKLRGGFLFLEETKRKNAKRMQELEDSIDMVELKALIFAGNYAQAKSTIKAL